MMDLVRVDTATAEFRASGPGLPGGGYAVNGASLGVECTVLGHERASIVTSHSCYNDGTGARLGAGSARYRTGRPSGVHGVLAVDGAGVSVAGGGGGESGTNDATVLHVSDDRTRLSLGASAAGLGARAVRRPAGDLAVHSASETVAWEGVRASRAHDSAVGNTSENRAGLCLGARSTTGRSARGIGRPRGHLAVNRASLLVAHTLMGHGAFFATVGGVDVHAVRAELFTSATGLTARGTR